MEMSDDNWERLGAGGEGQDEPGQANQKILKKVQDDEN